MESPKVQKVSHWLSKQKHFRSIDTSCNGSIKAHHICLEMRSLHCDLGSVVFFGLAASSSHTEWQGFCGNNLHLNLLVKLPESPFKHKFIFGIDALKFENWFPAI